MNERPIGEGVVLNSSLMSVTFKSNYLKRFPSLCSINPVVSVKSQIWTMEPFSFTLKAREGQ